MALTYQATSVDGVRAGRSADSVLRFAYSVILWALLPSGVMASTQHAWVESAYLTIEAAAALAKSSLWPEACRTLGQALRVEQGPWQLGAFAEFHCGKPPSTFGQRAGATLWRLRITSTREQGMDRVTLNLSAVHPGGAAVHVTLPPSQDPLALLKKEEISRRLAALLLDGLPMRGRVARLEARVATSRQLRFSYPRIEDDDLEGAPTPLPPPKQLLFYRLRWDAGAKLWLPDVIGAARRQGLRRPSPKRSGLAIYELPESVVKALHQGPLWMHAEAGAGAESAAWRKIVATSLIAAAEAQDERLATPLLMSANDVLGFAGLRYGMPFLRGDPLLEKTQMLSLMLEVRAGYLKGLQYYYDKLPETRHAAVGIDGSQVASHITWARHVLGYTLSLPLPWILHRLTLTPKLGLWNMEALIAAGHDEAGLISELRRFKIDNAISTGVELGAELLSGRVALRPWGSLDAGFSLVGDSEQVTSRRLGMDVYVAGPRFDLFDAPLRLALLGFIFVEAVELTSDVAEGVVSTETGDAVREVNARQVAYSAGYVGAGVALSW